VHKESGYEEDFKIGRTEEQEEERQREISTRAEKEKGGERRN
jgi:hypothetical protein